MKNPKRQPWQFAAATCLALFTARDLAAQDTDNEYEEHEFDEIVVKGAALDRTVRGLAQPTTILGGDALAQKQAASLGETLSDELGLSSSYFGPVSSRPVIRGQFGERVRVLSNGLDSLDASALSEDHAVSVDSILTERVEIVRGPATLLYGSGAAGGLVNVIDTRIIDEKLDDAFSGTIALGSDSATGKESGASAIAFGTKTVAIHLDYFRRNTDNVEIPGFAESAVLRMLEEEDGTIAEAEAFGVVNNTDSTAEGGAAAVSLTGDNGFVGVSLSRYDNNYGIAGHGHVEDLIEPAEEESVRIDLEQERLDLAGEYDFTEAYKLKIRLGRSDYTHVELEGNDIGTIFETEGFDGRAEFRHGRLGPFDGAIGVQLKDVDFNAIGEEAFVPPSSTNQISFFLFEEWAATDQLIMQGSARLERQQIEVPSQPRYGNNAVGAALGAIWSFSNEQSLALNFALTERHPNATELYADGAHVAVNRVERGSVTRGAGILDTELSANVDLTLHGDTARFEWTVTAFLNDVDDYILLAPTGDIEDELQVFEYAQTDARLAGLEAETRIELLDTDNGHLHTRLFTDFVRGEDRRTNFDLPRIPPLRYGIGFHYTQDRFEASVEARFHNKQDRIAPGELPTENYTLVNVGFSYVFSDPGLFIFARGSNLTDEDARQHSSPLKETLPLPGRSIQLGLRYSF